MKKVILLGLTLLSFNTNAVENPGVDTRCFISMDNKIKMRLLTVSAKEWGGGYVQYGEKNQKYLSSRLRNQKKYYLKADQLSLMKSGLR